MVNKRRAKSSALNGAIWHFGVKVLLGAGFQGEKSAKTLVGKWYATYKEEDVLSAIISADKNQVTDPVSYIEKILSTKPSQAEMELASRPVEGGQWGMRMDNYRKTGFWATHFGPRPGEAGCQCPPELLRE